MSSRDTHALKFADAMPVRTIVLDVSDGPDRGAHWEGEECTLGTAGDNALVLRDDTVSRYHVRLGAITGGVRVVDLGSTNGTFVGDVRVERCVIPPNATLKLGRTSITIGKGTPTTVDLHDEPQMGALRGRTEVMRRLMSQITRAAQGNVAVLLVGESGTGKELLARALHDASPRANGPFVTVDCGSIMPTLVASELFGHEKGAFTGALSAKKGAFEEADGGTLFLDEIGELPTELQTTLLGALERRRFCRVGGRKEVAVDVRVVSATNRDLRADVNSGAFRLDLYYRLAVISLDVPPLRERAKDIPLLVEHFAREEGFAGPIASLVSDVKMAELGRHRWPGNVRELRNYVQATVVMGEATLSGGPLQNDVESANELESDPLALPYNDAKNAVVRRFERDYLTQLLARANGNVAEAARVARMARSHLNELLRRHGIR